jgi:Rrf2 family protein
MLSYTCETAVKAVIFLATQSGNTGIKEIAKNLQASEHTVGKMLQTLVKQGVISSLKGPSGGFFLSQDQKIQPLIHIVEAIDGKKVFSRCGLGLSRCSETHPCPIHNEYKKPRDMMEKIFKTKKVQDLCEPVNNGFAYLFG